MIANPSPIKIKPKQQDHQKRVLNKQIQNTTKSTETSNKHKTTEKSHKKRTDVIQDLMKIGPHPASIIPR